MRAEGHGSDGILARRSLIEAYDPWRPGSLNFLQSGRRVGSRLLPVAYRIDTFTFVFLP